MIAILSPAKNLDFETEVNFPKTTQPQYNEEATELIKVLKTKKSAEIGKLMKISEKLSDLNYERYQNWSAKHTKKNARPAVLTFNGDAYQGLDAQSFNEDELLFAQDHLRILSGLYGLLKPLDLMQAYRLEMGTSLKVKNAKNLYQFWGEKITNQLNKDLKKAGKVLVNVASNEYFKVLQPKNIDAKIIECQFKDFKNGQYKTIMTYAKKARGMMCRYIIQNEITNPKDLLGFDLDGYEYNASMSKDQNLVFTRN